MAELTTTALVQGYLSDATLSATTLATYINAAEDAIALFCNRKDEASGNHWLTASRTQYITTDFARELVLRWTPVTAIASISTVDSATATTALTLGDLQVDQLPITGTFTAERGIVGWRVNPAGLWGSGFPMPSRIFGWDAPAGLNFGRGAIKVAYTGGYAAAPPALVLAATQLASTMYRLKNINVMLTGETLGSYSYQSRLDPALLNVLLSVQNSLAPYVRYPS